MIPAHQREAADAAIRRHSEARARTLREVQIRDELVRLAQRFQIYCAGGGSDELVLLAMEAADLSRELEQIKAGELPPTVVVVEGWLP